MNLLIVSMLISAGVGGVIASFKGRSPALWMSLGLCTGPIAVALVLCLSNRKEGKPSKRPALTPPVPKRSIVDEIHGLAEMRERGLINDDEFLQGKVQILAWPVSSPIPPALTPQRVWADGRRTWASYQSATRASLEQFARRHALDPSWRSDVPLEVPCTFLVQPGLSFELSLALEKGTIHCWGAGWDLDPIDLHRPEQGLPPELEAALDALVCGAGRVVIRQTLGATAPFWVTLQTKTDGRWHTVRRRCGIPASPIWRRTIVTNTDVSQA
ncbi:SHOCT domain-containing protein [Sphingomonas sp. H160509]|uniref:SHOCT domain-containing protein n=1 Tax=Sphingomonas sp. H160509 TaxID=2955313 RepID=UPI00209804E4|nr:SHOCT domain-containing protein [Sphingomonas sp. H160509]MDD1453223.1 SHOCT domain-containing protein [Sphingomonas sp. H160509]